MKVVEIYYTVNEASFVVKLCTKSVIEKLKKGEFGPDVLDLAKPVDEGKKQQHDYRIPSSGLIAYLQRHRVFSETEIGIKARSEGELRRKVA